MSSLLTLVIISYLKLLIISDQVALAAKPQCVELSKLFFKFMNLTTTNLFIIY